MEQYLVTKYLGMLSPRFRNFKQKSPVLFNFSCPACHDSKRNKRKARGYIYERDGKFSYICHNCGLSLSFDNFLKEQDYELYAEYLREKLFKPQIKEELSFKVSIPKFKKQKNPLEGLIRVDELPEDNPYQTYLKERRISGESLRRIYYTGCFHRYINSLILGKFDEKRIREDEARIIFPFLSREGELFALSARTIRKDRERYINIVLDSERPRLFGQEIWNPNERTYIFEGCIDSLFIPNSLATGGGDLASALKGINTQHKSNYIIVYDKEPYSNETKKKLTKAIDMSYPIVLFPHSIRGKDVNEMILNDYSSEEIQKIMNDNIFSGLQAKLALAQWSKK